VPLKFLLKLSQTVMMFSDVVNTLHSYMLRYS